jgi:hypothetical protein
VVIAGGSDVVCACRGWWFVSGDSWTGIDEFELGDGYPISLVAIAMFGLKVMLPGALRKSVKSMARSFQGRYSPPIPKPSPRLKFAFTSTFASAVVWIPVSGSRRTSPPWLASRISRSTLDPESVGEGVFVF